MTTFDATRTAAIVTGHSRGLGEAIATHLLTRGVRVLGVSRRRNEDLVRQFGALLREVTLDLSDDAALTRWLESAALEAFAGELEMALLVNNAGVLEPMGAPQLQDVTLVPRAVAVNVGAVLMLTAAFARVTSTAAERRVLQVSSGAGRNARAGWSVYCSTKAAVDHHARCVALDAPPRFRISSVAPGVIDTEMQAEIRATTDERFPNRPRFVKLHRDKELPSPAKVGGRLVDYLLSNGFGAEPVFDLENFKA
jgi:NAD(P)-dependent dehydrogenase (short-subunit alcohol dehydrogenase family)